jgi:hypothetical protein
MLSESGNVSVHYITQGENEGENELSKLKYRVPGCLFTSRTSQDAINAFPDASRLRFKDTRPETIPCFDGCPAWSKPLMHSEYQVSSSLELRRQECDQRLSHEAGGPS